MFPFWKTCNHPYLDEILMWALQCAPNWSCPLWAVASDTNASVLSNTSTAAQICFGGKMWQHRTALCMMERSWFTAVLFPCGLLPSLHDSFFANIKPYVSTGCDVSPVATIACMSFSVSMAVTFSLQVQEVNDVFFARCATYCVRNIRCS